MAKNLKIGIFLGVLLFGIASLASFVYAGETLPKGGDSLDDAILIEPGKYTTNHDLKVDTYEFFKIDVQAGQMLKIKFGTAAESYAGATIYDADEEKVEFDAIIAEANASETISWSPSSSGELYFSVGNEYDVNAKGSQYDISLEDRFDADSKTDAGDRIKNALPITPGEYEGYLSGDRGTDAEDFYRIAVKKGEAILIKAVPENEALLSLELYDSDQEILDEEIAENDGAAVSITATPERTGDLYFAVSCSIALEPESIQYTLNVKTKTPSDDEAVSLENENEETEVVSQATETKNIFKRKFWVLPLWAWILIILGVILIIIIILWLIFRKKKPADPEYFTGTKEAAKPVVGYKHPCKYCGELIPPNSNVCPRCGKVNPQGPLRCPKCHEPIEKDWKTCHRCNLPLYITCPKCGKRTFFGDYCEHCDARLTVICSHCQTEQPPIGERCNHCNKKLKK